jgi:hypothetical protein
MLNVLENIGVLSQRSIPVLNLVYYWKLDETSGTTIYDAKNAANLFNNNGSIVTGFHNNGIQCNNTAEYLSGATTTAQFESNTAWSYSFWIKREATPAVARITFRQDPSNVFRGTGILFDANKISFVICANASTNAFIAASTNDNTFTSTTSYYNIVWTYNGNRAASGNKIYVDSVSKDITATRDTLGTGTIINSYPLYIGNHPTNASQHISGILDEIAIYNKELTQTEIDLIYNGGLGLFY